MRQRAFVVMWVSSYVAGWVLVAIAHGSHLLNGVAIGCFCACWLTSATFSRRVRS